jgi:hypothetical protein
MIDTTDFLIDSLILIAALVSAAFLIILFILVLPLFTFKNPSKSRERDSQIKLSKDLAKLITQSVVVRKVGDEYKLELKTDKKSPCRDWSKAP